jgi:threonyl-tRNA synthetase
MLKSAAASAGLTPAHAPKAGAFYGPKLEFALPDRLGRRWQCGTIQLDLVLPERFDIAYVDAAGARVRPLMLHRATLGSLERFLGVVLEQHDGRLPAWLAPDQVMVLPIEAAQHAYAGELAGELRAAGLRVVSDLSRDSLGRRVALAHEGGIPYVAVVGRREHEARSLSLRHGEQRRVLTLPDAVRELALACAPPL